MYPLLPLIILGVSVLAAAILLRPRPSTVVLIQDGKPVVRKGSANGEFLALCEELCAALAIREGKISAYKLGRRTRLRFSRQIPDAVHQRLRNAWHLPR